MITKKIAQLILNLILEKFKLICLRHCLETLRKLFSQETQLFKLYSQYFYKYILNNIYGLAENIIHEFSATLLAFILNIVRLFQSTKICKFSYFIFFLSNTKKQIQKF